MSVPKFGLVGLPNVGKSSLFNKIVGKDLSKVGNFPFCTIKPHHSIASVFDPCIEELSKSSQSENTVYPKLECVDIAGLVKGASNGDGLGNEFLSNIREVDMLLHIVRCFEDDNIVHVSDEINPLLDIRTINDELILSDLQLSEKLLSNRRFLMKQPKDIEALLKKATDHLMHGNMLSSLALESFEALIIKNFGFISSKKMVYIANGPESDNMHHDAFIGNEFISIDIYNSNSINKILTKCYEALNLITFYTTGKTETAGWSIVNGTNAQNASGAIHSGFIKRFIAAKVSPYDTYFAKQITRSEGRDYIIKHRDICNFQLRPG